MNRHDAPSARAPTAIYPACLVSRLPPGEFAPPNQPVGWHPPWQPAGGSSRRGPRIAGIGELDGDSYLPAWRFRGVNPEMLRSSFASLVLLGFVVGCSNDAPTKPTVKASAEPVATAVAEKTFDP